MNTYALVIIVVIEPWTQTNGNFGGGICVLPVIQLCICGMKRIPYHRVIALVLNRFFVSTHGILKFFLLCKRYTFDVIRIAQFAALGQDPVRGGNRLVQCRFIGIAVNGVPAVGRIVGIRIGFKIVFQKRIAFKPAYLYLAQLTVLRFCGFCIYDQQCKPGM